MVAEYRGKFKPNLWNRPICTDDSEPLRLRQKAKRDFRRDYREEDGPMDVASADLIAESFEIGDPALPDSDQAEREE